MTRPLIIATVASVSLGLGYFIGALKSSVVEKFAAVDSVVTMVDGSRKSADTSDQSNKENFDDFIYRFHKDSLFQLDRVKFPLMNSFKENFEGGKTELIDRPDWKIKKLLGEERFRTQIYDNFERELRDTDERLFCWEGNKNEFVVQYKFSRIDGLWFLVELSIFNTPSD